MLPDRVSNPGPLTYESGALPIALPGPAISVKKQQKHILQLCRMANSEITMGIGGGGGGVSAQPEWKAPETLKSKLILDKHEEAGLCSAFGRAPDS